MATIDFQLPMIDSANVTVDDAVFDIVAATARSTAVANVYDINVAMTCTATAFNGMDIAQYKMQEAARSPTYADESVSFRVQPNNWDFSLFDFNAGGATAGTEGAGGTATASLTLVPQTTFQEPPPRPWAVRCTTTSLSIEASRTRVS